MIVREMKDIGFEDGRKDFDGQKRYFAWIGLQWKPTSVKAVKVVKALPNLSLGSKEKVVNCPDNPDNPDKRKGEDADLGEVVV